MTAEHDDDGAEAIREQAAMWIAHLGSGEPSVQARADFEAWLAADLRHGVVFRRMEQRFDNARLLQDSRIYAPATKRRVRRYYPAIAGGAVAAAVVLMVALPLHRTRAPEALVPGREQTVATLASSEKALRQKIAAPEGEIKSVGLSDGSTITLDGASVVAVAFTSEARNLTLLRGRARFSVAHERRPFVVQAGSGSVVARGTLFDVSIGAGGRVDVVLLRGKIDVTPDLSSSGATGPSRLTAGQAIAFGAGEPTPSPSPISVESNWADRVGDFDNVTLAYVLDRANAHAMKPIRVAEPDLGQLKVSGRFRVTEPERLADNLASLFGLRVETEPDSILLSRD
jgi:transmembrane sensor